MKDFSAIIKASFQVIPIDLIIHVNENNSK